MDYRDGELLHDAEAIEKDNDMKCICTESCFGAGGVKRRFEKDEPFDFDECPPHFKPAVVYVPAVVQEPEEPETLTELQDQTLTEEAAGRPTEEQRDGANIFE